MEEGHKELLLRHRSNLVDEIKLDDSFWKIMKEKNLITQRQESRIKNSGEGKYDHVEALLELLPKLGREAYIKFRESLVYAGQERVVLKYLTLPGEGDDVTDFIRDPVKSAPYVRLVFFLMKIWLEIIQRTKVTIRKVTSGLDVALVQEKTGSNVRSGVSDIYVAYLAPELCVSPPQHSEQADVWGIACVIIHGMSGKAPWHDKPQEEDLLKACIVSNPGEIVDYIPRSASDEIKLILSNMLKSSPSQRWSAAKLLEHSPIKGSISPAEPCSGPLINSPGCFSSATANQRPVIQSDDAVDSERYGSVKPHSDHFAVSAKQRPSVGLEGAESNPTISATPTGASGSITSDSSQITSRAMPPSKQEQPYFKAARRAQLTRQEQIVSSMAPEFIRDTRRTPIEFWDLFKRLDARDNLPFLGLSDGYTMLHLIVLYNRTSFLDVIFNLGIWVKLVDVRTEGGRPEYLGLTAMEMAQKMNHSVLWKAMDKYNRMEESMSILHKAARAGSLQTVTEILAKEPSSHTVNLPSQGGRTPLYWAVTSGNYEIIDKLVAAGGDIFCQTEDGDTLLTRAVSLNQTDLVKPLVGEWGLDPNIHGLNRRTPLYLAAENGHVETFKALINHGATLTGMALISAAVNARIPFMKMLISEFHLHPNWMDIMGKTPVLAAAGAGQMESLKLLLEYGGNITLHDKRKRNIIHFTVESGSEEALKTVIEICKEKKKFDTLLNEQDLFSGAETIFLVRGKDQGRPAWHYVLVKRSRLFLFREKTQGGPIDVANYGNVVLSGWGQAPNQGAVKDIERKYSPDQIPSTAPRDLTPLMLAITKDQHAHVQILLAEKPNLEVKDCYGLTAFHLACMKGSINTVRALVLAGAKTNVKDNEGNTPLDIARENGHSVVVSFLESRSHMKKIKKFVHEELSRSQRALDSRTLEEVQNRQGDIRRYSVQVLRDLQADINQLLYDLGTAPIGQATSDEQS